jgi:tetratricopeptide (TPR) repeat protein
MLPLDRFGLAAEMWKAIELQKTGNIDEAVSMWEGMRLPRETDHWRLLMLGVAYMQNGNHKQAEEALNESKSMMPENPVVFYTLGLLWLGRADSADEWYDASGMDPFRLASTASPDSVPLTRSMYQMAAMMAFERAVGLADKANLDQPLLPENWQVPDGNSTSVAVTTPRVRDALEVFEGDRFEGRSHLALGLMHMQRGGLEHAEKHLDSAAELGEPTGSAFHKLGQEFEKQDAASEAMRAHLKAYSHGGGAACLEDAFRQFGRAMIGR